MIVNNIFYTIFFSFFASLNLYLFYLNITYLKRIIAKQKIIQDDTEKDVQTILIRIRRSQEETVSLKNEILREITEMRSEWDMETLKMNILQRSHGNSRNWEKWAQAFGGSKKEVD